MMRKSKYYFEEEQKLDVWWVKLLVIVIAMVSLGPVYYGVISQLSAGVPWGDKPMSDTELIIVALLTTIVIAGVAFLMFFTRLETIIKEDGIHIKFFPFFKKKIISTKSINRFEVRKYKPIMEYGGWGIRHSLRKGKAYNMSGNIGLQLYLSEDKKLLIGTKRPEAIKRAMDKLMSEYG